MYSELLQTPHPNRLSEFQQPLHEALQLEDMHDYLADLKTQDENRFRHESITAANTIASEVHKSLWFRQTNGDPRLLKPEGLAEDQTSNCYGYTIVLSECLEKAGIKHWVGFVNGHALTIVRPDETSEAWLIDSLSPRLNGPLKDSVDSKHVNNVNAQIAKHGRAAIKFSSGRYISNLSDNVSFQEVSSEHPWLSFGSGKDSSRFDDDIKHSERIGKQRTLVMSLFTPSDGRGALVAHNKLVYALGQGKRADAYRSFKELARFYPDVDIRNQPKDVSLLVRELGSVGCVGMATKVVDETRESLSISQDPRHDVWQADMYRWLGNKAKDQKLMQKAIDIYNKALSNAKHPEFIVSKRSKAERQLARLATSI